MLINIRYTPDEALERNLQIMLYLTRDYCKNEIIYYLINLIEINIKSYFSIPAHSILIFTNIVLNLHVYKFFRHLYFLEKLIIILELLIQFIKL